MGESAERVFDVAWVRQVLSEAEAVIRTSGLNSDALGGPSAALDNAAGAIPEFEARRILNAAVRLAHHHNRVLLPADLEETKSDAARVPDDMPEGWLDPRGVGIIRVPGLSALDGNGVAGSAYARSLDGCIRSMAEAAIGWVFDLADNDGGNMHPMIAGLVGVLGSGRICGFRDRDDHITWVDATTEVVKIGDNVLATVPNAERLQARPTAVLVGPSTASSGEWTALSLVGRCSARLFGQSTAGYLTGVEIKPLPSGCAVGVTGVYAVDNEGRSIGEALTPDVRCPSDDPTEAIAWVVAEHGRIN